jgi:SAM-dependent methyltransferase
LSDNWYEDFFDGLAMDLWRGAFAPEETEAEADWIAAALGVAPGAALLDVPCGEGRHALALARRGYRMTGIDLSRPNIERAERESRETGLDVRWRRADMRRIDATAAYDGAYCFGNSFGYLSHEGMVEFVRALSSALVPGARFVLDTGMAAESILPESIGRLWMELGGVLLLVDNRYEVGTSRLVTDYTFVQDGAIEKKSGSHQVYTVAELDRLLGGAGLRTRSLHGGIDGSPFEVGSSRLLLTAEKIGR